MDKQIETSSSHTYSLADMQRKSIIDAISLTVTPNRWRVVVVDQPSLKIVSNSLKMHAILEQNVMAVQLITRNRQRYPEMDAIYILVPCADSILRMIDDFSVEADQQEGTHTKYAHAHLFFTGELSNDLFTQLTKSRAASYIKNISELFVEFNPFESRVFLTTPSEQPFYSLYSPNTSDAMMIDLDAASDRLLSVIATLGIRPFIRYYSPKINFKSSDVSSTSNTAPQVARAMADRLQIKLDEYFAVEQQKPKADVSSDLSRHSGPPSVILVLDRSIDLYAPLIHELSYQAMVYDLVGLDEGEKHSYTIESNDGQTHHFEAELNEKADPLWEKLRHEHIGTVADILATRLERLAEESAGVRSLSSNDKKLSLEELKRILADFPDFNKKQSLYSAHSDLVSKCMEAFDRRNLSAVVEFERELVTQVSSDGDPIGRMSLETRLVALLDDHDLDDMDRFRLLLLYLVYVNGGSAIDRRRLQEVPQCLSINDKRAAINLQQFGIPINRSHQEASKPPPVERYKWNAGSDPNSDKQKSWFVPAVERIISEQLNDELDSDKFPWTQEIQPEKIPRHILNMTATSLRRNKGNWDEKRERKKSVYAHQKGALIIYIAGGMTFSEIRSVYEMARKYRRQIYIGSTHIITPGGFLNDLKSLHLKMLM